ncbi:hypothetical protein SODALDRAFT_289286 [Sodiomyces alkalinus F11]|uniref:Histone acetyltransferase n=1 Tax=Sodiomyces alkalinus (strain CBS 110278 / VKM F-3762 / F11) TaxID=1314773 RepID=A0A3N2Q988_SODAK|nr:hypothetical protein SODALDRAFT_289286 [Sodiomyces alkalinus F11]ROT43339.1 hypothetical protein SODALDRAFT_289286 [Sodiomyces alkalinus F11]
MTDAQITEEELQQSVVVSEEDLESEDTCIMRHLDGSSLDQNDTTDMAFSSTSRGADNGPYSPPAAGTEDVTMASNIEAKFERNEDSDGEEDAEGEEDFRQGNAMVVETDQRYSDEPVSDDGSQSSRSNHSTNGDSEEEYSIRGDVGNVVRGGSKDDQSVDGLDMAGKDESDYDSVSRRNTSEESDAEVAWEDAPEWDDEDESEALTPNLCVFCKQEEEHDPGEEFEEPLACVGCGESSHQYCARVAGSLGQSGDTRHWKCPECASSEDDAKLPVGAVDHASIHASRTSLSSTHSTQQQAMGSLQLAQDGLGGHNDTSSVGGPGFIDGDSQDGSRSLRKRKASSSVGTDATAMSRRRRQGRVPDDRKYNSDNASLHTRSETADGERPRKLRLKVGRNKSAVTITRRGRRMVVKMRLDPDMLRQVVSEKLSTGRKRKTQTDGRRASRAPPVNWEAPLMSSTAPQPFYSFMERETDEMKTRPYGGILNDAEADTSKTLPTNDDRKRFDEAKQKAEEEWRLLHVVKHGDDAPEKGRKLKKNSGPASHIECIEFGGWEIDTWYAAPYPEEYSRNRILYICEFCLKYMNSDYVAWRHKLKCPAKHPPGDEIYRHGSVSVFEVDGRKNPVYCQNLCLLAKLFLGSKTLYYDVEPFLFYVLCEYDELGYHFVGYFSKEKRASSQNNVSCILTLPIHQRKGYGNLLIDFSYLLTRVERKTGSPEKPLSDMGLVSYRNYWRLVICRYLLECWHDAEKNDRPAGLSLRQISDDTGLTPDDVIAALEGLRCLIRDSRTGLYGFRVNLAYCREYMAKWESKNYVKLNPEALTWTPYVMGRGSATNFELGPAITAIAPREEDEGRGVAGEALESSSNHIPNGLEVGPPDKLLTPVRECGSLEGSKETSAFNDVGSSYTQVRPSTEPRDMSDQEMTDRVESLPPGQRETGSNCVETKNWAEAYKDIPVSRFEVFPPLSGRRTDRPRSTIAQPTKAHSSGRIPRLQRSAGSSVRRAAVRSTKPNNSSRRKTGGTGRGPGRWPKGTKKSDYGNAASGPGFPPAWIEERRKLAELKTKKPTEDEASPNVDASQAMDTVRVRFDGSEAGSHPSGSSEVPATTATTNIT